MNHPETFRNYFVIEFDKPFEEWGTWENRKDEVFAGKTEGAGDGYGAYVRFKSGTKVQAKAASSYISPEQALVTLERELGADKTLEATKKRGAATWNALLGRIDVEGGTDEEIRTFYSCLFRANLFAQVLRARRRGQPLLLQPLRRQGARRVHVHRQRLLGHVPLAVPADEHPAPHHAGPLHAGAAGRAGAVRLAPLVVRSGRDGRHARQPLDFAADGRLGQGHPHVRPGQGPRSLCPRSDEQGPVGRRQRPRRMEGVLATGLRPLSRVDGFDGPDARIRLRRLLRLAAGPHDRQQVLRGDLRPRHV